MLRWRTKWRQVGTAMHPFHVLSEFSACGQKIGTRHEHCRQDRQTAYQDDGLRQGDVPVNVEKLAKRSGVARLEPVGSGCRFHERKATP